MSVGGNSRPLCSMRSVKAEGIERSSQSAFGSSCQINQEKSAKKIKQKNTRAVLICICCSIVVDVSYSSVLGDIVGTENGLKSEHISSVSLVSGVLLQCLYCIAILVGLYYTAGGTRKGRV